MRISVIIVAYNRRKFLIHALKSVVNQSMKPHEVVVVKNFNDDEIEDFIEKHGFISILYDDVHGGAMYAKGIEETNGDVLR